VKLQILHVPDCPNTAVLAARLDEVLEGQTDVEMELEQRVVADHNEATLHKFPLDAARGVGEDHGLHTHARENADGKHHLFRGIALIKMDAALHASDRNGSYFSDDEFSRVADGGRLWKVRNLRVGNFGGTGKFVRKRAEP